MAEREYLLTPKDDLVKDALNINQAFSFQTESRKFVVGGGIKPYSEKLGEMGFENFWLTYIMNRQVMDYKLTHNYTVGSNQSKLMYAYVDFVIEDLSAKLFVFLPNDGYIKAGVQSWTTFEVERVLFHIPLHKNNINFVKGLFEHKPQDINPSRYKI